MSSLFSRIYPMLNAGEIGGFGCFSYFGSYRVKKIGHTLKILPPYNASSKVFEAAKINIEVEHGFKLARA